MQVEVSQAEQQYRDLYQQYMYVYGVLAIMVELEGGVVAIPRNVLNDYDLTTTMTIRHEEIDDTYVIEVTPNA